MWTLRRSYSALISSLGPLHLGQCCPEAKRAVRPSDCTYTARIQKRTSQTAIVPGNIISSDGVRHVDSARKRKTASSGGKKKHADVETWQFFLSLFFLLVGKMNSRSWDTHLSL